MKGTQEVQPRRDPSRPWLSSISLDQANARHADRARARASGVRRQVEQVCLPSVDRLLTERCVRRRIRPIQQGRDVRQRRPLG